MSNAKLKPAAENATAIISAFMVEKRLKMKDALSL